MEETLEQFKERVKKERGGGLFGLGKRREVKSKVWVSPELKKEEQRRIEASRKRLGQVGEELQARERPAQRVTPFGEPDFSSTPSNAGTGKDPVTVAIEQGQFRGSVQGGVPRGTWRDRKDY